MNQKQPLNSDPISDDDFLQLLASAQDACHGMDISDNSFFPKDGEYEVLLMDLKTSTRVTRATQRRNAIVEPVFSILEGPYEGRTFQPSFWIPEGLKDVQTDGSGVKNLARLATCVDGTREVTDPVEAIQIIKAATDTGDMVIRVQIKHGINNKTGKALKQPRIWYLSRLDATEETTTDFGTVAPVTAAVTA